jgi:hypothetical protein
LQALIQLALDHGLDKAAHAIVHLRLDQIEPIVDRVHTLPPATNLPFADTGHILVGAVGLFIMACAFALIPFVFGMSSSLSVDTFWIGWADQARGMHSIVCS